MDADNAPNITLRRLGPHDAGRLTAASDLFDAPITEAGAREVLTRPGHHLLLAEDSAGRAVGFVSGVETAHPDKGTEMFLDELAVAEGWRRRGVASHLVNALAEIAREGGCYGMWTAAPQGNEAALATYRSTGARLEPGITLVVYDLA